MPTIPADELKALAQSIYVAVGASEREAETVAELLVSSNLAGHDSHGVIRCAQYVKGVQDGKIRLGTESVVERETAATAVMNGNWGFGHVIAVDAMNLAIEKARKTAVGIVTVHQCNHIGRVGAFPPLAADANMVGLVTNNGHGGDHALAPWGGIGRILPAACYATAFPTDRDFHVAIDLTNAVAAGGKLRVVDALGEQLPDGWQVDADGNPSNDPKDYLERGGALVPFGGPVAHKGSALGIAIDILSGALSPAGCTEENPPEIGNALFVQAIDIEAFQPIDAFKGEVGKFIDYIKKTRKSPDVEEIFLPGERSHRTREERLAHGIPLADATWDILQALKKDHIG